eukprot:TRINITY_DN62392_c0_g1_i1.p1 TRINITY_DN62392_c0_g1~~TRINITY_DN62392_c0_g1_i1.p1  ORF type:complete len:305 (+),score=47.51 TRINITY_DN62392_c0_g1_i1:80-994(+)
MASPRTSLLAVALLTTGLLQSCRMFTGVDVSAARMFRLARGPSRNLQAISAVPEKATQGVRVRIEYTGTMDDGKVFATTDESGPLDFICGEGEILPAIEEAVQGLGVGESRELKFGEDKPVFGPHLEERIFKVPKAKLPEGSEVGTQLMMKEGMPPVLVVKVGEEDATLDANHPLAGKGVSFNVKVVELMEVANSERLLVETVTPGDGKTFPNPGDKLSMHYTGTLASNSAQFDSSRDRGEPFQFQIGVGQVIQGWDKGVMKMSLGERATLRIPSAMGYGARGAGSAIPPNADLVFDVELLAIN